MATAADAGDATLPPDDAFGVLGNETRMAILQELAAADGPLPFSMLRDRVGVRDSGQFNYHLDKLTGHFVGATDDGYELRRAGERIIEAVVSGAVTETPVIEPTQVDLPCPECGAPAIVSYQQEWLAFSCTECEGSYDPSESDDPIPEEQLNQGYLGGLSLPPAAVQGRSVEEVVQTAWTWDFLERIARSHDICPRCSAKINRSVEVCEDHDASDGLCEECGRTRQVIHSHSCPNCHDEADGPLGTAVHGYTEPLHFVTSNGFNPIAPIEGQMERMREATKVEVASTDPVEARIIYSLDEHYLSLRVDEDLNVMEVSRTPESAHD